MRPSPDQTTTATKAKTMTEKNDEIQLPAIFKSNLPKPAEVQEQMHEAFGTIYTKLEAEIAATPIDLETKKGRDALASLAYKISRTKTGLDKTAKGLTDEQTALINAVNQERKEMRETLDKLRDKAREPLNKWEEAEKKRVEDIEAALAELRDLGRVDAQCTPAMIEAAITSVNHTFAATMWDEYEAPAKAALEIAVEKFNKDLEAARDRMAKEQELEELRALKAEQERKEAEARAKAEAEAEAKREAEQEEARQKAAQERAEREAAEKIEAERKAKEEAEQRAKQAEADRIAAEKKAEEDKAAAIEAERKRIEEEERQRIERERAAAEAREADLKHRKKINNAALEAIMKASEISEDQAKMIVQAIAKGQVPHTKITY